MQTQTSVFRSNAKLKNDKFIGNEPNTIVKTESKRKDMKGDTRVKRIFSIRKGSKMVDLIVSKSKKNG
jgi:hypothetical protein